MCGGLLISGKIPLRKEDGSYTYYEGVESSFMGMKEPMLSLPLLNCPIRIAL